MPTRIESIEVAGVLDKRLVLNRSNAARVISVGSDWSKLRIGFRMAFTDYGVSLSSSSLYMGLLSNPALGLTNGPLSLNTGHFAGWTTNATTSPSSWTRAVSSGRPYYNSVGTQQTTKIGNTLGAVGSAANTNYSANPLIRQAFIIEFTKGTPWTTEMVHPDGSFVASLVDIPTLSAITDAMEMSNMVSVLTWLTSVAGLDTYTRTTPRNLTVDEVTNGELNAVVVGWNRSIVSCIISELCWAKIT